MPILKSFLKASFALGLTSFLCFFLAVSFDQKKQETESLKADLARVSQEALDIKNALSHHESLKKKFLAARSLGLLEKSNRQKLLKALKSVGSEKGLEHLDWEAGLSEKRTLGSISCQWTAITLTFNHLQDVDVFLFLQRLPDKIPGVLIPEQLSLARHLGSGISGKYDFYVVTLEGFAE